MLMSIQEALRYDVDGEIRRRLDFIRKYISAGNKVGYYDNRSFVQIKLTELVSFDNAIVIGTCWDDYEDITDKELYAINSKGGIVAVLTVSEDLKSFLAYIRRK